MVWFQRLAKYGFARRSPSHAVDSFTRTSWKYVLAGVLGLPRRIYISGAEFLCVGIFIELFCCTFEPHNVLVYRFV